MQKRKILILLTCEHADKKIPSFLMNKVSIPNNLLSSHAAYDEKAFEFTNKLKANLLSLKEKTFKASKKAKEKSLNSNKNISHQSFSDFKCQVVSYPYTRLLIDANRTKKNKNFKSVFVKELPSKDIIKLEQIYDSYSESVFEIIEAHLKQKYEIFIFSIHSFVPIFKSKVRKTEVGLLFRTKIKAELFLAEALKLKILEYTNQFAIHKNRPYQGHTDCFLNMVLDYYKNNKNVNGLFFEFNQKTLKSNFTNLNRTLAKSLIKTII